MKQLKIDVPTGYEIDVENSNLEEGIIKFKEKKSVVPKSITDVNGRDWFINSIGIVCRTSIITENNFSTRKRAQAMLALGQLVEIYRAMNQKHDAPYSILISTPDVNVTIQLSFDTKSIADEFESVHESLINKVKAGL